MTLATPVKIVLLASAFAALAACAATPSDLGPSKTAATDTQQWMDRIKVTAAPDEIVLATHAVGLSVNQSAALDGLMGRWLEAQARELVVTAPNAAGAMAVQIRERLIALGAPAARVRVVGFDPAGPDDAVIRVGFVGHAVEPIKCGQRWGNLAATRNNEAYDNFGCAVAANLAAQVANPEDLVRPRDMTPPDAGRRDTVFGKYRKGEITSSAKDEQANGALSKAIK
ncbi:CpaD family pilus assembly lipoprotein [Caulobacter sp. RL271]|jgi:pilus assembly protein CpaD|uniref:CpaD family pilus assembly lipoprotein n=1 Tax=Caulobacter segnis TaxID=88688 RepID=A0ABY4ZQA0_9CAUL|nr:CpaD family pilus assembly lipoprotein [Caulobacter segnis]USQ94967.1 CpaD family pilus assembly lipoprotein [Caulobacter segnis]